ncbi:sialate O-acetylesterase [Larkinella rosea]|uniref:T9SS C-terminal target domain-containing protein n=1 Tax=Larkinella rosea TaxID=2025312 RepID=A0A3P1C3M2_9BACT|nr:sialate O-acetylesterase [Larkinella rosea]RRB07869.1 T9SS C-terminal target domain-containing protein [Larkinella rosea]
MKKSLLVIYLLFVSIANFGQSITLPGQDGTIFQRCGVGQGAGLEIGFTFNDAGLSQVQVLVEKYTNLALTSTTIIQNWTSYSCDPYPGVGGVYKRVIVNVGDGMYRIKIRRQDNNQIQTDYRRLGVGEVFYVAGQSNTTGKGDVPIPATLEASLANWIRFENNKDFTQVHLNAPYPACITNPNNTTLFPAGADGSDPNSTYVAHWRRLAEKLVQTWNVPIAIYQAGWSGTTIDDWSTGANGTKVCRLWQNSISTIETYPYYNLKTLFADRKYNGARAVLWHQGEFDGALNTAQSVYESKLRNLISQSRVHSKADMGVTINLPWVISQASKSNGVSPNAAITNAQSTVAGEANNWLGPNTDLLNNRVDGTHFNQTGLVELADAWFSKLTAGGFLNGSTPIPAFGRTVCCTTLPAAPTISPISSSISAGQTQTLTASGCVGGTITWSNGSTGTSLNVSPATTSTYSARCTINNCTSLISGEATVTVTGSTPLCNCGYTLMSASQVSGQMQGQYTFSSCNVSAMTWQLKNGSTILASGNVIPSSATVTFSIPSTVASGNYTLRAVPTNCSGDGNSVYEKPFAYTKPSTGGLTISPTTWSPDANANSQIITVTSNVNWSVSSNSSWLTVSPSSGINNGTFTLSVSPNTTGSTRSGTATVISSGGGATPSVTVIQSAAPPVCNCGYTLMSASQISGQMKGQYVFSSCSASSMTWQLKNGSTILASANVNPSSSTVIFDIPSSVPSGNYTLRAYPTNCSGDGSSVYEKPFAYSKPGGRIGIDGAIQENGLVVSPNPSTGHFKVNFYVEPGQRANLSITDLQGKTWHERSFLGEGNHSQAIHMASQARGIFLISVKTSNRVMSKKVIVHP